MSTFFQIDSNFAIEGEVNESSLKHLKENFNSVLYLCPDAGSDKGAELGFATFATTFPGNSIHIPMDPGSQPAYQTNSNPVAAVHAFGEFSSALNKLSRPTVIICKSNRRASAVYCAYKAVNENLTPDEIMDYARQQDFRLLSSDGLIHWLRTVAETLNSKKPELVFRQLFEAESSTYTYLLAERESGEAMLIDPVLETVARDAQLVRDLGLTLKYVANTHVHADHITGTGKLKEIFPGTKSVISAISGADADIHIQDGESLSLGGRKIFAMSTPGHTEGCFSYLLDDFSAVFTGDCLLVRGCGRTDFQGGSSASLYRSVHDKYFTLPESCTVYPGHDYKGFTQSSIKEEKELNPRLTKSLAEFEAIMDGLGLPYPKKFDASVPANLKCGVF